MASKSSMEQQQQPQQAQAQLQQQIQHTVHELEPLARYSMRVVAVNSVGNSKPSVALSLRTEEEGESLNLFASSEAHLTGRKPIKSINSGFFFHFHFQETFIFVRPLLSARVN